MSGQQKTMKNCPHCAEEILAEAKKCKHCGEFMDGHRPQQGREKSWNPGLAAVLSFFVPGLGQIYKGDLFIGILILIMTGVGYSLFIVPGVIMHILAVYTAYTKPARGDVKKPQPVSGHTSP